MPKCVFLAAKARRLKTDPSADRTIIEQNQRRIHEHCLMRFRELGMKKVEGKDKAVIFVAGPVAKFRWASWYRVVVLCSLSDAQGKSFAQTFATKDVARQAMAFCLATHFAICRIAGEAAGGANDGLGPPAEGA